jgi:hypothetical protein
MQRYKTARLPVPWTLYTDKIGMTDEYNGRGRQVRSMQRVPYWRTVATVGDKAASQGKSLTFQESAATAGCILQRGHQRTIRTHQRQRPSKDNLRPPQTEAIKDKSH